MDSRLDRVKNWEALASAAHYSVAALAEACEVSRRHLDRYFEERFGLAPHAWMEALRAREAETLLSAGEQVKAIAAKLGYTHVSSFSRAFKRVHGLTPRRFRHSQAVSSSGDVPYR